jgi:hypothetical protein
MLMDDWRSLKNILAPATRSKNEQEHRLETISGGVLEMYSLDNADAIRGRKFGRFIINEAAFVPELLDIWNNIIRSTLIDYRGDGYISGTPKGRNGFWNLYNRSDAEWWHFHASSYANPHIPREELDRLKGDDRSYRQEILAEFLEDGGSVIRYVLERACAARQSAAIEGHEYIIGVDWARTDDATVFAVLDATLCELCYLDRMVNTDYNLQRTRLKALAKRFMATLIVAEYNSMGGPQIEMLQADGLPIMSFTTTNRSKAQVIDALALAFETGALKIIDEPVLTSELMAYESEALPGGLVRYGAPEGMHDDTVIALALAYSGLATQPQTVANPFYNYDYRGTQGGDLWD